ncbi:MAG: hypothetical protein ACK5MQ_10855 [Pikeienuella sp.]
MISLQFFIVALATPDGEDAALLGGAFLAVVFAVLALIGLAGFAARGWVLRRPPAMICLNWDFAGVLAYLAVRLAMVRI